MFSTRSLTQTIEFGNVKLPRGDGLTPSHVCLTNLISCADFHCVLIRQNSQIKKKNSNPSSQVFEFPFVTFITWKSCRVMTYRCRIIRDQRSKRWLWQESEAVRVLASPHAKISQRNSCSVPLHHHPNFRLHFIFKKFTSETSPSALFWMARQTFETGDFVNATLIIDDLFLGCLLSRLMSERTSQKLQTTFKSPLTYAMSTNVDAQATSSVQHENEDKPCDLIREKVAQFYTCIITSQLSLLKSGRASTHMQPFQPYSG